MNELLELAKRSDQNLEQAFGQAAAEATDERKLLDVLAYLAEHKRTDQAELLAFSWLSDARGKRSPAEALALARKLLLAVPSSEQLRTDTVDLYRQAYADRDIEPWLSATGLTGSKVSPQRACRALEVALSGEPGTPMVERTSHHGGDLRRHRVAELVSLSPASGTITYKVLGGGTVDQEVLRVGDEFEIAAANDFRVMLRKQPEAIKAALNDDPLGMLVSMVRAAGDQLDADQLKDNLTPDVLTAGEYAKWWTRARTAAKKSPNLRIEGRSPSTIVYDSVGVSLEQEALAALAKSWEAPERLAIVETYLKNKSSDSQAADPALLKEVAGRVEKWLAAPDADLADALAARRLADLGVPVSETSATQAVDALRNGDDLVAMLGQIGDAGLWLLAVELLPQARPVGQSEPDWQAIYLQLLPHAPLDSCDRMAAALIDAGQIDRLNAAIIALVESPADAVDGLCWLWIGPAQADKLQMPRTTEMFDRLLQLAKHADNVASTEPKLAKELRAKIRNAISARGYATFRQHVGGIDAVLAPILRRQIRRADGLGLTIPEQLVNLLDEVHPPIVEVKPALPLWQQDDVIYVCSDAMAAKERELDQITNVEMPANSRAIAAAASHGDLSENSEYKFALEERDLLRARAGRVQQELAQARILSLDEVPSDHVSIYSRVRLEPIGGGEPVLVQIVSPWDSSVADRRYNYKAPLSANLLGKQTGDAVRVSLDGGEERDYMIQAIMRPHD